MLAELRRVLVAGGRLGLLVLLHAGEPLPEEPEGNDFPTRDELEAQIVDAGFRVDDEVDAARLPGAPTAWSERADRVEEYIARHHRDHPGVAAGRGAGPDHRPADGRASHHDAPAAHDGGLTATAPDGPPVLPLRQAARPDGGHTGGRTTRRGIGSARRDTARRARRGDPGRLVWSGAARHGSRVRGAVGRLREELR